MVFLKKLYSLNLLKFQFVDFNFTNSTTCAILHCIKLIFADYILKEFVKFATLKKPLAVLKKNITKMENFFPSLDYTVHIHVHVLL